MGCSEKRWKNNESIWRKYLCLFLIFRICINCFFICKNEKMYININIGYWWGKWKL